VLKTVVVIKVVTRTGIRYSLPLVKPCVRACMQAWHWKKFGWDPSLS